MSDGKIKNADEAQWAPSPEEKPLNYVDELDAFLNDPKFIAALVKRTGTNRIVPAREKISFMREAMTLYFLGIEASARGMIVGFARDNTGVGFQSCAHHGYAATRQNAKSMNSGSRP